MNYQQAIDFIQSFPDSERGLPGAKALRSLKMPLPTMKALLGKMGNPQNGAPAIHVAGSKGKGSTATFIASILKEAGLHTALFTSPHMHSYTERIAFDGQAVSEDVFAKGITEIQPLISEWDQKDIVSTFGIVTALFFHLVKTAKPAMQRQVVEVGLGGTEDLTNVFAQKEAAVITPISLEHTAILGNTRIAIAGNKAGIITPGCLVVLAPQPDEEVVKFIRQKCAEKEAQLVEVNKNDPLPYPIQLRGDHQISNALTALTVIRELEKRKKISITQEVIERGLATAFLPGRFEVIMLPSPSRVFAATGGCNPPLQSASIVLDGAHNGDSAEALAKTLREVFPSKKIIFVIGVNQDKDLESIWLALKDIASAVVTTQSDNYRSLSPEEISKRIANCDPEATVQCVSNITEALEEAKKLAKNFPAPIICVCGSLYLVAEARERLITSV